VGQHAVNCVKLSGDDLSHYSNKTELFGLRKCPYYHYLTKKVMSQQQTIAELAPHHHRKTAGIDMV